MKNLKYALLVALAIFLGFSICRYCKCTPKPVDNPIIPKRCEKTLYKVVYDTVYSADKPGKFTIITDSIPYRCNEYIFASKHPNAKDIISFLKSKNYVKVKECACASGLELWRYAGDPVDAIGVVDPPPLPKPGTPVGGLMLNFVVKLPPAENFDNINALSSDNGQDTVNTTIDTVRVAVLDTGVDANLSNPVYTPIWRFARKLLPACILGVLNDFGVNIIDPTVLPNDANGHGTHVNGIVSGLTPNSGSQRGVPIGYINIKIIEKEGDFFDIMCGLYYALEQKSKVINASWGFYANPYDVPTVLTDFINKANKENVLIVAGIGNDKKDLNFHTTKFWPACYAKDHDNVISVGAVNQFNFGTASRASFSNWSSSPEMSVSAWGESVPSSYPLAIFSGGFAVQSGTSMATPFVARTAAVMYGLKPTITVDDVKKRIVTASHAPFSIHDHNRALLGL
jgi:subtilisin family serine protease